MGELKAKGSYYQCGSASIAATAQVRGTPTDLLGIVVATVTMQLAGVPENQAKQPIRWAMWLPLQEEHYIK